jgi:hypothetical protein
MENAGMSAGTGVPRRRAASAASLVLCRGCCSCGEGFCGDGGGRLDSGVAEAAEEVEDLGGAFLGEPGVVLGEDAEARELVTKFDGGDSGGASGLGFRV